MKIAISGKMKSGKSCIANFLVNKKGYQKISFASDLKLLAESYFGVTKDMVQGRQVLQDLGKIGRLANKDFWVKRALEQINSPIVVIDDLRFKNEAEVLKENGFITIRINSSLNSRLKRGILKNNKDISEVDLDNYDFDYVIENNNSLKDLYEKIEDILFRKDFKMNIKD